MRQREINHFTVFSGGNLRKKSRVTWCDWFATSILPRILHAERQQRQEWEKIQGRFADILFGLSIEEFISLVASAIDGRTAGEDDLDLDKYVLWVPGFRRLSLNRKLPKLFANSMPLHPYTAVMLL